MRVKRKYLIAILLLSALLALIMLAVYILSTSRPSDTGVDLTAHNDGLCVIGWANSHQGVTTSASGYIPYADIVNSAPTGAQIKVLDLNNGNPITTANMADVDILFIADAGDNSERTNYVSPTGAQLSVINAAFNTGMHVVIGSDNSGTGAVGRQFAAMMGMPVTNNLANPKLRFLDTIRTVEPLQGSITSAHTLFNGLTYDTTGSAITPGILTYEAPGECIASVNQRNTTNPSCFVGYLPRTATAGFLIVDGNAGKIARQIVASGAIWDEVSDCAPYAPSCGNGILDSDTGEQCDDGAQNGAVCTPDYGGSCSYCSTTCQIVNLSGAYCGDGNIDPVEECDNADQNGMACVPGYGGTCSYCSTTCQNVTETGPYCGDGNIDPVEQCDNASQNGMQCVPPYAGSCSYCDATCQNASLTGPYCGDGIINGSEQCDGNAVPGAGDICSPSCTLTDNLLIDKSSVITSLDNTQATIQYSITVSNPNSISLSSRVVDQLPSFVQAGDVTNISNGGIFNSTAKTITWDPLVIPANGSVTLTYRLRVLAANFGTIDNLAIVYDQTGNEDDRDTESNLLSTDIQVLVNKNHTSQIVNGATVVNYIIQLQNIGTTPLVNLHVQDTLDNAVQTSWISNISHSGVLTNRTIDWNGINLQPTQSLSLSYTVTFPAGMFGTFENIVIVTDPSNQPLGQDTDSITIPPLDLMIDKTSSIQTLDNTQATIQYSITVTNPNALPMSTRVVDQLPSFVQAGDVTNISNGGVFNPTSKTITWDPLVIPANSSVTVTYTLTVAAANFGNVSNLVIVYDPDGGENDRDSESIVVDPDIQLHVNKSHTRQIINGATVVEYTIEVRNNGSTPLLNLRVQDTLPTAIQANWVSNISHNGVLSNRIITWTGINLQPGMSLNLTYTITYPEGTVGTFGNLVIVSDAGGQQLGQDTDPITIASVPTVPTAPVVILPDTAIFGEQEDLIILGILFLIIGILMYHLEVRLGFGRLLIGKPVKLVFGNNRDFETDTATKLSRKIRKRR